MKGDEGSFFCTYSKGCAGQHHKRKLQVNLESDIFHCWVCNWKGGSLLPILRRLGDNDPDYQAYKAEHEKKPELDATGKVYETPRLPKEFQTLSRASGALHYKQTIGYLTSRGITSEDILDYKLGYCPEGHYAERVIIPSFDDLGELNFFVGRTIWKRPGDLPYLSGRFDKDIVFNDLLVDWAKPITLVEGPFDAIKAGHNAIALQGKVPSRRLMAKIYKHAPRTYIALDADAGADSIKIAGDLVNNGVETFIVRWPAGVKDPGELTKEQFEELKSSAISCVHASDVMKQRVYNSSSMGRS